MLNPLFEIISEIFHNKSENYFDYSEPLTIDNIKYTKHLMVTFTKDDFKKCYDFYNFKNDITEPIIKMTQIIENWRIEYFFECYARKISSDTLELIFRDTFETNLYDFLELKQI